MLTKIASSSKITNRNEPSKLEYALICSIVISTSVVAVNECLKLNKSTDHIINHSQKTLVNSIKSHPSLQKNVYLNRTSNQQGMLYSVKNPSNHGNSDLQLDLIWYLDSFNDGFNSGDTINYQITLPNNQGILEQIEIIEQVGLKITGFNQSKSQKLTSEEINNYRSELIDLLDDYSSLF